MTTLLEGETTEVPEQRPNPIPAPSEMKMTPLTRYSGAVGSAIVSEVAVRVGLRPEAWAAGPSIDRAASIRSGVQKRRGGGAAAGGGEAGAAGVLFRPRAGRGGAGAPRPRPPPWVRATPRWRAHRLGQAKSEGAGGA